MKPPVSKDFRQMMVPIIVLLVTGAYSAVGTKIMYKWPTTAPDGQSRKFEKPYFFTFMMFVGEGLCLFYKLIADWQNGRKKKGSEESDITKPFITDVESQPSGGNKPHILVFLILSAFDLSATALTGVGQLWVTASATQMLRGSMILFTGFFSVVIFRKNLGWRKWGGIAVVVVGLVLVGASGMMRGGDGNDATGGQVLGGVLLIVAGSALNSLQNVFEEKLLKGTTVDPLEVVGWEGIFGSLLCVVLLLPIAQAIPGSQMNSNENTTETLFMLTTNAGMCFTILGYSLCLALMNFFSQLVAKYMSAVIRMLLSTCRVVLVWVVNLFIYYAIPNGKNYGENWDVYSWLQLAGFVFLIAGTAIYMKYPAPSDIKVVDTQTINNDEQ